MREQWVKSWGVHPFPLNFCSLGGNTKSGWVEPLANCGRPQNPQRSPISVQSAPNVVSGYENTVKTLKEYKTCHSPFLSEIIPETAFPDQYGTSLAFLTVSTMRLLLNRSNNRSRVDKGCRTEDAIAGGLLDRLWMGIKNLISQLVTISICGAVDHSLRYGWEGYCGENSSSLMRINKVPLYV